MLRGGKLTLYITQITPFLNKVLAASYWGDAFLQRQTGMWVRVDKKMDEGQYREKYSEILEENLLVEGETEIHRLSEGQQYWEWFSQSPDIDSIKVILQD